MNWQKLLQGVAPMIGTAIGGPLGGAAASFALDALGIKPSPDADDNVRLLEERVKGASPEDLMMLKKADNDFEVKMAELGIKKVELSHMDRTSAREREEKVGGYANPAIATVIIIGFLGMCWAVLSGKTGSLEGAGAATIGTVIGYVSAKADQVVSYYFGSSSGQDHQTAKNGK